LTTDKLPFDEELVKKYPRSNRKIFLMVRPYSLDTEDGHCDAKAQTTFISPYGFEFQVPAEYPEGTLLKINVTLPDYWQRKQQHVEYSRIDTPGTFKVLAKVVRSEDIGKRGKKKLILVQTVNIDSVDELVLKTYLQESK
jgi:hypothetical protein